MVASYDCEYGDYDDDFSLNISKSKCGNSNSKISQRKKIKSKINSNGNPDGKYTSKHIRLSEAKKEKSIQKRGTKNNKK